jgi:hypothetical protein
MKVRCLLKLFDSRFAFAIELFQKSAYRPDSGRFVTIPVAVSRRERKLTGKVDDASNEFVEQINLLDDSLNLFANRIKCFPCSVLIVVSLRRFLCVTIEKFADIGKSLSRSLS